MIKKLFTITAFIITAVFAASLFGCNFNGNDKTTSVDESKEPPVINIKAGETIKFGTYKQNDLEWLVLAIENGKALLITKDAISQQPYNTQRIEVTWKTSSIRGWLKGAFYDNFSGEEKQRIVSTLMDNSDNQEFGTLGGNQTTDEVFLLSIDQANKYFVDDISRTASFNGETCYWWLRSPGEEPSKAANVFDGGFVNSVGYIVDKTDGGVRPAMWIKL
jgi:biopolymer transport protein ExbD